jgi:hypothetical protein
MGIVTMASLKWPFQKERGSRAIRSWDQGGYRFGDYVRLGLPLSILVIVLAVPLISWFWPLAIE